MDPRVIELHDDALRLKPGSSRHDESLCPICVDWSLDVTGVPTGFERLDEAQKPSPFGDVEYADPGILPDGVKRYPLDTEAHIEAAVELLEREEAADLYPEDELENVRQRAQAAAQRVGAKSQEAASEQPKDQEGGSTPVDTITQETHEALLQKAVDDATKDDRARIAELEEQVSELTNMAETAQARVTELEQANEQVSAELDEAQVKLNAATDENAQLKQDIADRETEAEISERAEERAEQVRNLGLFQEEYVKEKARDWAEISEDDWSARVEEWQKAKGTTTGTPTTPSETPPQDTSSAMEGSNGEPSGGRPKSLTRAVLGLD
jgi:hypothetical protein